MTPTDQAALNHLTQFLKRNPQILLAAYGKHAEGNEMQEFQSYCENPSNWQMLGPRPPIEDDYFKGNSIGVYIEGVTPNQYVEPTNTVPASKVAFMRYFAVLDEMSDCGFNLLEIKDGGFRVGQLADNWPE